MSEQPAVVDEAQLPESGAQPPATPGDHGGSVTFSRSARSLVLQARLGLAVGILGILVAASVLISTHSTRVLQRDIAATRTAAELVIVRVSTWDAEALPSYVADLESMATPEYAPEVRRTFSDDLQSALRSFQVDSVGEIDQSFVQDVTGDDARVYVRVLQTFTVPERAPVQDQIDYEVTLRRVDGEWLADGIVALGPTQFESIASTAGDGAGETEGEGQ